MEIPAPERVEPRKTGHEVVDLVLSICALLISALSIFMAYYTGDSMDQLVQANSWPALQLTSGNASEDGQTWQLDFEVINAGVGPALVYSLDYRVDGVTVSGGNIVRLLAEAACGDAMKAAAFPSGESKRDVLGLEMTSWVARSFLSPREKKIALRWPRTETNRAIWECMDTARQAGRITLRSCYCSVFDECWVAETHTFPPRKVDDCKAPSVSPAR
jgi:hypothetical protein